MIFLLPVWSPENAYLVGISLKHSQMWPLIANPVPGAVFSVSVAPSALWSHWVPGGGSWLGEQLSILKACCCQSQDEHRSGDRGSRRIWHGQTLEKAIGRGGQVMGTNALTPSKVSSALSVLRCSPSKASSALSVLEVLTEQHEEMRERSSRP